MRSYIWHGRLFTALLLLTTKGFAIQRYGALDTPVISMTSNRWLPVPDHDPTDAQFLHHEGFQSGVLLLKRGSVSLDGVSFRSGTIDLDIKPVGDDFSGIRFRSNGTGYQKRAEEFYIRNSADCRASDDCVQYAPVLNGFMLWNVFPQFQSRAFVLEGWNHLQLRISEHRMLVFLNGQPRPSLVVERLQGDSAAGAIELTGSAYFANLQIDANAPAGLKMSQDPIPKELHRRPFVAGVTLKCDRFV